MTSKLISSTNDSRPSKDQPDHIDKIDPRSLKVARKRQRMTQQQLADAIHCTKDTVSRWERSKSRRVRSHLQEPLCKALGVTWERLTEPIDRRRNWIDLNDDTTKVSIAKYAKASLLLVAERYDVRPQDVLNLAPLLFLIVAERSLLERRRRLEKIKATMKEADEKLLENCAHLGGIITARSSSAENHLDEEEESLDKRDVFGRTIERRDGGPFVRFIRDLQVGLPKDAVTDINPLGALGDGMIEDYRIADDTMRACTGISGVAPTWDWLSESMRAAYEGISDDKERSNKLLGYLHYGVIDFTECLRVKRNGDDENYEQWLSRELANAENELKRQYVEFLDDMGEEFEDEFGPSPALSTESDAFENGRER